MPIPHLKTERSRRRIPLHGEIGSATAMPSGCRFHPRCFKARLMAQRGDVETAPAKDGTTLPAACIKADPAPTAAGPGRQAACHFPLEGDEAAQAAPMAGATLGDSA